MRFAAMASICLAATIVLNESANDRWSHLVLGTPAGSADNSGRPAESRSLPIALKSPQSPGPVVTLGRIEFDDVAASPIVLRPISVTRVPLATWTASPHAPRHSSVSRGGQAALSAAALGRDVGNVERR